MTDTFHYGRGLHYQETTAFGPVCTTELMLFDRWTDDLVESFPAVDSSTLVEAEIVMSVQERLQILRDATPNTWLAFSSDESELVGRGQTFSDAANAAENAGEHDPILMLVPASWSPALL